MTVALISGSGTAARTVSSRDNSSKRQSESASGGFALTASPILAVLFSISCLYRSFIYSKK